MGKSHGLRKTVEHPWPWVQRMVEGRWMKPSGKTLYWWSIHLDRFLRYCRKAGRESTTFAKEAAKAFLTSFPRESERENFAAEEARMAVEVFLAEVENWHWGVDKFGREVPLFRLKAHGVDKGGAFSDPEPEDAYYNLKRKHSILGCLSPNQLEASLQLLN